MVAFKNRLLPHVIVVSMGSGDALRKVNSMREQVRQKPLVPMGT